MTEKQRPYGELMRYRHKLPPIYEFPTFISEYALIGSKMGRGYKVLDFGCGEGKVYNEYLISLGLDIEYVGIDPDPHLGLRTNFKIFKNMDEFEEENLKARHFDGLFMLNILEHLSLDETYDVLTRLNPYIDGDIFIMTPNPKCFDYMFADPEHKTFYTHEFLYGLLKHLNFENIEIWRGKGIYQIREEELKKNPGHVHLKEMNEFQRRVCLSMGLDWMGNLLIVGSRADD